MVSEQDSSGQCIAAFCRDRGLPVSQFFAWRKRLRQAATESFVELRVAQAAALRRAIEIRLGCGRSVMVEAGFDAAHLLAVLDVLEARA